MPNWRDMEAEDYLRFVPPLSPEEKRHKGRWGYARIPDCGACGVIGVPMIYVSIGGDHDAVELCHACWRAILEEAERRASSGG